MKKFYLYTLWFSVFGAFFVVGQVAADYNLRIVCDGSLNTWDRTGQFSGSFPKKVFFSLDFEAQKMTLDGGYYENLEYRLAPNQDDFYRAAHSLSGGFLHGKETVAVSIELNRFSGKGVQSIHFKDGSEHYVFLSESGCVKADEKF